MEQMTTSVGPKFDPYAELTLDLTSVSTFIFKVNSL